MGWEAARQHCRRRTYWPGIALVVLLLHLDPLVAADADERAGGPDPASLFEVQGRTFWNKSLGLDRQPHGLLGHQCSNARPGPHPEHTLDYTPNRRWPEDPEDGRSAIVMAVGGEPQRFYNRIKATWATWRGFFTPHIRNNTALIILLDRNFYNSTQDIQEVLKLMEIDCGSTQQNARACEVATGLDQGYELFVLNLFVQYPESVNVWEPQNPFVVFIALYDFPHPFWIERANMTEADILAADWRTDRCNFANYAYTKFTNWYSYHMLSELRILDYFDYWWKIDDDVRWFGHLPMDLTPQLIERRRLFFHTAMDFDPWWCIGPSLAQSIELYLDTESELCGRALHAAAEDKIWWTNDTYIYLSEFVGGWLGMYTSPELLEYGRIWNYFPFAMWTWRWGDQQFWTKANGLFDDGSNIEDLSYLKQSDTSEGPPKGETSMMFYHG